MKFRAFPTQNPIGDYTSGSVFNTVLGNNRSIVFQVDCHLGDRVTLQTRLHESLPWIDVMVVEDAPLIHEIINAPEYRILVSNTSGLSITGGLMA